MKKYLSISVLGSLVLIGTACGNNGEDGDVSENASASENNNQEADNSEASGNDADGEEIELVVAWWGGQERHDLTLEVIEMYEEQNPNVSITPQYSGFDGYFDNLSTQFAAGNAPDVIQYGGNLNDYVSRDVALPLDDYVGEELDISLHDETMLEAGTFEDQLYGITLGTNAWGVIINESKFEEAGVELPDEDWTWDDFEETAVELSNSLEGTAGTEYFDHNGFGIFIDQKGKLLHEDGELGIDQQDAEDWYAMWQGFRESGAVVEPEIQAAASTSPEQSMIVSGDVAMQLVPSNQLGAYRNATEDTLSFHPHPQMDGRSGVALRPSQFLAGYSDTEHPEEVASFIDFFVNDPEATEVLGNDRGAPVNSEVRESLIESADETDADIFAYVDHISETSDSPYVPNLPGYNETEALFKTTSEDIAFGQVSVEEGAERYFTELQESLEQHQAEEE